jgi:hypothetical protein
MPIGWSPPTTVASFSAPITAEEIASMGSILIAAATSGMETYLFEWTAPSGNWTPLDTVIPGTVDQIATTPLNATIVSVSGTSLTLTTVSSAGDFIDQGSITPTGAEATGVLSAGVAVSLQGASYVQTVVFTTRGSDQVQFSNSTDYGPFSTPTAIGAYNGTPLGGRLGSTGEALDVDTGGSAGQLAFASIGAQLLVLWTSNVSGRTIPLTESSGNNGSSWEGPYLVGPMNGSALDPVMSPGPTGLVYAAWEDPDFGSGAIDEAVYFADGSPMLAPSSIPTANFSWAAPGGKVALAVGSLAQPLILWPGTGAENATTPLDYSGQFLSADQALQLDAAIVNDPLQPADLPQAAGSTGQALSALIENVSSDAATAEADLQAGNECQAENVTGLGLYQNLTHSPLVSGGTTCGTELKPALSSSPLADVVGIDAPNTYLAVYVDWSLEALGVQIDSSPLSGVSSIAGAEPGEPPPSSPSPAVSGEQSYGLGAESVTVTPIPYSPTEYDLEVTAGLPNSGSKVVVGSVCGPPPNLQRYTYYWTLDTNLTWLNISVTGPHGGVVSDEFSGSSSYPSAVWPYDMFTDEGYSWTATFSAWAYVKEQLINPCDSEGDFTDQFKGWIPTISLSGQFSTELSEIEPVSGLVTAEYTPAENAAQLEIQFVNTLPANDSTSITELVGAAEGVTYWNSSSYLIQHQGASGYTSPTSYPVGSVFNVSVTGRSRPGSATPSGTDSVDMGEEGAQAAETSHAACQFSLADPTASAPLLWTFPGGPFIQDSSSTARVTWYSNASFSGFFTYQPVGAADWKTQSNVTPTRMSNGSYNYTVELHGLQFGRAYNGTFGAEWATSAHGCLSSIARSSGDNMSPGYVATLWETDSPYDSVTHIGGGANITWELPPPFVSLSPQPTFQSGSLEFADLNDSGQSVVLQITNLSSLSIPLSNASLAYGMNVTLTDFGSDYSARLELSFTESNGTALTVVTPWVSFVYERDSSGDGLTDTEKEEGWVLPVSPSAIPDGVALPQCAAAAPGSAVSQACADDPAAVVHASPAEYATNGLVSDYVEKEFDLDPSTIDTMHSHMLDTWNLTFNLGPVGAPAWPSGDFFEYYDEDSTYNFSQACQSFNLSQPPGACTFTPIVPSGSAGWTNLTWKAGEANWIGDSSPMAAKVLWPAADLGSLESLIQSEGVGWLRAVSGQYGSDRTLTVWGKLSWGANPLARSTSNDGLADGNQTDPLGPIILQLNLTSWWAHDVPYTGSGVSPSINVSTEEPGKGGQILYSGWGPSVSGSTDDSWSGSYVVSIPITSSNQTVYIWLNLFAGNFTGGLQGLLSGSEYLRTNVGWFAFSLATARSSVTMTVKGYASSTNIEVGSMTVVGRTLVNPGKANTLLVTPENNSTLAGLPWGLNRYTGEPDFDLLVVNASERVVVPNIQWAGGGGSYDVTLEPGLNNILVPRTAFVNSPLGQALLNNTDVSFQPASGSGVTFDAVDWSTRTQQADPSPYTNPDTIQIFSSQDQEQNGSSLGAYGGIPGAPLDEMGNESLEIQSVIWISIEASGDESFSTAAAESADLFGGLILNLTGNVTNNLLNVTVELPSLGLPAPVLAAMANSTVRNDGSYDPPVYGGQSAQSPGWLTYFSEVWNSLSGVVSYLVDGAETLLSVAWSATIAAFVYLLAASVHLAFLGIGILATQTVAALKQVASAMVWALDQLFNQLYLLARAALALVIDPIVNGAEAFDGTLAAASNATINDIDHTGVVAQADGLAWAHSFDSLAVWGTAIGAAVVVALTILLPFDQGATLILRALLSLVPSFVQNAIPGLPSLSSFTSQAVLELGSHLVSIPHTTVEAIAGGVAIAASSSDLFAANVKLAMQGAVDGLAATVLVTAIVLDIIVLVITIINWAAHLAVLALIAVCFASIGFFMALTASTKGIPELAGYAEVSLGLALVGLGAAGADYYLQH